ncbi:MAG: DUF1028 domain-containing protein [Actinomycetota bacterium]
MTLSLVAADPGAGECGVAVMSSSPAVAARCAHVRPGVGAVASQNVTDPRLGPLLLDRLAAGAEPTAAVHAVVVAQSADVIAYRQLLAVDLDGRTAIHSGDFALGVVGEATGPCAASAGNLLAAADVPDRALAGFAAATGALAERLLAGLEAGVAAGGEAGPVHSAGLVVARDGVGWPVVDLRVDWADDDPVGRLRGLWERWRPELEGYVTRGLRPAEAPSFGVPGDE